MAIPFLQHLDLKSSAELRNALLHKTTSGNASDVEAAIIYDTGSDTVKYYNGSAWISLTANTTYDLAVPENTTAIRLAGSDLTSDDITISGTTNEVEVTRESATELKIGLPDNVIITGNLTVNGTTTSINSNEVNIGDAIIKLNADETIAPSQNAGLEVERGTLTNVFLIWNEVSDRWTFTNDGTNYYNIPVPTEYDNFNFNVSDGLTSQAVSDGGTLTFAAGVVDSTSGLSVSIGADNTITYTHYNTSNQASVNNSGRTYIQDITLDTYGHITGITSATETVVNTNTQLATASALISLSSMAGNSTASFTHGLASKNLIVQLYDTASGQVVHADVDHTSVNAISIIFSSTGAEMIANSIGDIRVVVIDAKNGLTDKVVSYS